MRKFVLTLLVLVTSVTAIAAASSVVPDSMLTEDGVYHYIFSAPDKSKYVMDYLRENKRDVKGKTFSELDLDHLEGDMYYNTGHYVTAVFYYRRALKLADAAGNDKASFSLMYRLVSAYEAAGNINEKMAAAQQLKHRADKTGNKAMHSIAVYELGISLCRQNNRQDGLPRMLEANKEMEQCDYERKLDDLRYQYEHLAIELLKENRLQDALAMCEKFKGIIGTYDAGIKPMEHENESQEMVYLGLVAVVHFRLGREADARKAYDRFMELEKVVPGRSHTIYSYLLESHRYGELITEARRLQQRLVANGDTISFAYSSMLNYLAQAQLASGDEHNAALNYSKLVALHDSLSNRMLDGQTAEYNAIYDVELSKADSRLYKSRMNMMAVVAVCAIVVVALLAVLTRRLLRANREIKRKNVALALSIDELSQAYSSVELSMSQNPLSMDELLGPSKQPAAPVAQPETEAETTQPETTAEPEVQLEENDNSRRMFLSIEQQILSRKLYTRNLNREELIKELGIPRSQFAALFRTYAGESYSKYINRLRLREAVRIMRESPHFTVDAIAAECGMSRQLFYRLFKEQFGITPTEYRAAHEQKSSQQ